MTQTEEEIVELIREKGPMSIIEIEEELSMRTTRVVSAVQNTDKLARDDSKRYHLTAEARE